MKSYAIALLVLTTAVGAHADVLTEGYHAISQALAYDKYSETRDIATTLVPEIENWITHKPAGDPLVAPARKMLEGARLLATTSDEDPQRLHYATVSEGAAKYIKLSGKQADWQLYFCHMVTTFAYWAQPKTEKMANPYMGTKMLKCGMKKQWTALP